MSFTVSPSAEEHLQAVLPGWLAEMAEQELVPTLSYAHAGRSEKAGQVIWEYLGALFHLGGQKRERLGSGQFHDVLGFSVWIGKIDNLLLKGRVLTFMKAGSPEPQACLVIENAPDNLFQMTLRENCHAGGKPKTNQHV